MPPQNATNDELSRRNKSAPKMIPATRVVQISKRPILLIHPETTSIETGTEQIPTVIRLLLSLSLFERSSGTIKNARNTVKTIIDSPGRIVPINPPYTPAARLCPEERNG